MKKGKLLALAAGYLAGMVIALKFGKGGKSKGFDAIKKDIEAIHKSLWTETEAALFSEENKERIAEMREAAMKEVEEFKKEATKKLRSLAKAGKAKRAEIKTEIEDLYARRSEIVEDLTKKAIDALDLTVEDSEKAVEKLTKKAAKVAKEVQKELDTNYRTLKKKFTKKK